METYPYPGSDAPNTQPPLLDLDRRAIEAHCVRAQQSEAALVGVRAQTEALDFDLHAYADVPLLFGVPVNPLTF